MVLNEKWSRLSTWGLHFFNFFFIINDFKQKYIKLITEKSKKKKSNEKWKIKKKKKNNQNWQIWKKRKIIKTDTYDKFEKKRKIMKSEIIEKKRKN